MMRLLLFTGCLLWVLSALGQDADSLASYSVATDARWVVSHTNSKGECTELLRCDSTRGVVRVFYPSGKLKSYTSFGDIARRIAFGVSTSWYENGQLWARQQYARGKLQGEFLVYYPNGTLKRRSTYAEGKELIGDCYGPDGQPVAYSIYEVPPLYPGGAAMLQKDINRQLRMPVSGDIMGRVWLLTHPIEVVFEVAEDGSIQNPQIIKEVSPDFDAQFLKAIYQLPKLFRPSWRDGEAVTSYYRLSIAFVHK